jgi:DDE superfamily endonuclease
LEPDRTLATQRLSGHKKNKERISVALCANADSSHKINPLVIGKYGKPRCFKDINVANLPIQYRHNTKAWMLGSLFEEWLKDFDHEVGIKHGGQQVLLLVDNCPSHKIDGLSLRHVDVHFLPPNTTSRIQPMDAGIIMSFKRHYRRYHIR